MPTPAQVDAASASLSNVGKLLFLAFKYDAVMEAQISTTLFRLMRQNYEAELTRQAAAVGCTRKGLLGEGQALSALKEKANADAASIVRTYNFDLARAIANIRAENPRANRAYYTKRISAWEAARASWKDKQIALMTVSNAVQSAKAAFVANNLVEGYVTMEPRKAVEAVCQDLIRRGKLPLSILETQPNPQHLNCPHVFEPHYQKIPKSQCADLWLGQ